MEILIGYFHKFILGDFHTFRNMAADAGHLGTGHGPAGAGHGHFGTGHVLISSGHGLLGIGRGPSLKRKYHDSFSEVDQEGYAKVSFFTNSCGAPL